VSSRKCSRKSNAIIWNYILLLLSLEVLTIEIKIGSYFRFCENEQHHLYNIALTRVHLPFGVFDSSSFVPENEHQNLYPFDRTLSKYGLISKYGFQACIPGLIPALLRIVRAHNLSGT